MSANIWSLPVFRLLSTDRCRFVAPWFAWARSTHGTAKLRRLALALERERLGAAAALEQAAAAVAYFPVSLVSIFRALAKNGRPLSKKYGVSLPRQFIDLLNYSWRLGMNPRTYYYFRLHRYPWKEAGQHFIDHQEIYYLQRHISPPDIEPLEDKVQFANRSRKHGLPLVPILAFWQAGKPAPGDVQNADTVEGLPREDIFIKPAASNKSEGVMGLRYLSAEDVYRDEHRRWSRAELGAHLAETSRRRVLLVQPWLANHPNIQAFSSEALCNFRILTALQTDGTVVPIMAALRMPWQSKLSCAEPGITLCASVDLKTGLLNAAEAKDPKIGRLTRHPVSGQQIEGHQIDSWDQVLGAALKGHKAWPEFPFIGWDVVLSTRGIYILEGSCIWGGYLAQMSGSGPLGASKFPAIYFDHLAARGTVAA